MVRHDISYPNDNDEGPTTDDEGLTTDDRMLRKKRAGKFVSSASEESGLLGPPKTLRSTCDLRSRFIALDTAVWLVVT